ncbi:MAG: hypothetical protein R3E68_16025 [Burkholderiaceae bacterium]
MFGALLERFCADAGTRVKLIGEAMTGVWESLLDGRADIILAVGQGPSGGAFAQRRWRIFGSSSAWRRDTRWPPGMA